MKGARGWNKILDVFNENLNLGRSPQGLEEEQGEAGWVDLQQECVPVVYMRPIKSPSRSDVEIFAFFASQAT